MKTATIKVPVKLGVRGDVAMTVRNSKTGEVKEVRNFKNLLLNAGYLDRLFTQPTPSILAWGNNTALIGTTPICRIGSGTTTPAPTDTALATEQASTPAVVGQQQRSAVNVNPVFHSQLFRFSPGTYVGTVNEVGLGATVAGTNRLLARQLVTPGIVLGSDDELDVRWKITVSFGNQVFNGTITGGQRTGGNVNWQLTINNAQMMSIVQRATSANVSTITGGSNAFFRLFSDTETPYIRLGDDNGASDLNADGNYTIKGSQLFAKEAALTLKTVEDYTPGDLEREVTIGFEHNDPENVEIGEMVIGTFSSESTADSYGALCRVTFDPKLDKATSWRVFVKLIVGVVAIEDVES